jgi:23S rRNA (guanine2445-N2)-methyltransferase / 23S rRNA (guanine2069-N7)-methyltransferase
MDMNLAKDFGKLLKRHALELRRAYDGTDTTVMRVYNQHLEHLPITVDIYDEYVRITDYSDGVLHEEDIESIIDLCSRMLYKERENVIYHRRKKRLGDEQHDVLDDQSLYTTVKEHGLTFTVDLTKRVDTGLFLDQVVARSMIESISMGKRVLNLFSYTGSFSVYAARGGASEVISVDLSNTYSQWAQKNLEANNFTSEIYRCVTLDAGAFIQKALKENKQYDIIIFDPPTFSNSRKAESDFDVQRDYISYIHQMNRLLPREGIIYFSVNMKNFRFERNKISGFEIQEITKDVLAPGFSRKRNTIRSWILQKSSTSQFSDKRTHYNAPPRVEKPRKREIMKDNDDLVLIWDDEDSPARTTARQRRFERRNPGKEYIGPNKEERQESRQNDDERPAYDRRDRSRSSDQRRDRSPRRDNDRRSFDNRERRPSSRGDDQRRDRYPRRDDERRSFDNRERRPRYEEQGRERPPRRFDDDRRRSSQDGPRDRRSFGDRDRRPRYEEQNKERAPRRFDDERRGPSRDKRDYNDRSSRRFSDDRPQRDSYQRRDDRDRPPRRFDDDRRAPRSFSDRPPRRFDDDRRRAPQDGAQDRRSFNDRPPRQFDNERRSSRPTERRESKGPRPYGYDRFKAPATRGGFEEDRYREDKEKKETKE